MKTEVKRQRRSRRHHKIRSKIFGTKKRPRLSVFRSNKQIHLQLIDDASQKTLLSVKPKKGSKQTKLEQAVETTKDMVAAATKAGIKEVVFDRGGYNYHGRVKAVADTARELGLKL